jgi:DNA-binding Lrp family transcriptional regulator
MGTPKSIICQGITYDSVLELAERFQIHPSSVARRLRARLARGYSLDEAATGRRDALKSQRDEK